MKINLILLLVMAVALVSASDRPVESGEHEHTINCGPQFRYLITHNELYSKKVRNIGVFLEPRGFNESDLRELFTRISNRNPEPIHLTVEVKTDWRQLHPPTDCPPATSNMADDPAKYDYHQAIFFRRPAGNGHVEYLHYYPKLKTSEYEEIIMRGRRIE